VNDPPAIRAVALVHQEGVLALVAVIGLSVGERGVLRALAPTGSLPASVAIGAAAGAAGVSLLWLLRRLGPLERLEQWQRGVVAGWTTTDAVSVALVSGLAEEALLRAFLQPMIGLAPAAVLFAVLHVVPDRRLWFWPVFALASGLLLGVLFELRGFPAAAAAHILINLVALLRLRRSADE
jgi:membrane protease YdiL (CAAX protease family)